jgi:hypothetical protein
MACPFLREVVMSFLDFLENFRGSWLLDDGFLRVALGDREFPHIRDWTGLNVYLVFHDADAKSRDPWQACLVCRLPDGAALPKQYHARGPAVVRLAGSGAI